MQIHSCHQAAACDRGRRRRRRRRRLGASPLRRRRRRRRRGNGHRRACRHHGGGGVHRLRRAYVGGGRVAQAANSGRGWVCRRIRRRPCGRRISRSRRASGWRSGIAHGGGAYGRERCESPNGVRGSWEWMGSRKGRWKVSPCFAHRASCQRRVVVDERASLARPARTRRHGSHNHTNTTGNNLCSCIG